MAEIDGVCLMVVRDGAEVKRIELEEGDNLIGRFDPEAKAFPEVDLSDLDPEAKVSRKHALIERTSSGVILEDIGSTNGTFLKGGKRLEPGTKHVLADGEEFIVGKTVLRLKIG